MQLKLYTRYNSSSIQDKTLALYKIKLQLYTRYNSSSIQDKTPALYIIKLELCTFSSSFYLPAPTLYISYIIQLQLFVIPSFSYIPISLLSKSCPTPSRYFRLSSNSGSYSHMCPTD